MTVASGRRTRRRTRESIVWVVALACLGGIACERPATEVRFGGETMGTMYHVTLVDPPESADPWQAAVENVLEQVNDAMSTYRPDSELSRLNTNPTREWIPVSSELHRVLRAAVDVGVQTGGAFDVTVGPLVNLWGFGPDARPRELPSRDQIEAALERTGPDLLELRDDPPSVRKARPDVYVDLSAIAKGHAVDRLAHELEARGARRYLVEIGGEVRARGTNRDDVPWRVGVERPESAVPGFAGILSLSEGAVATSGDYRNYFERDGRRYTHAIDPRTGEPVLHRLALVSVVDTSATYADAWATGLLVLGPGAGYELALRQGLGALFVERTDDGLESRATPPYAARMVN